MGVHVGSGAGVQVWPARTNSYCIRAANNKAGRDILYDLPAQIKNALLEIQSTGLVFKSPVTNKEIYSPKRQIARLRKHANIPELTMHLFRHIQVSALGEIGTPDTILSASLGHTATSSIVKTTYQTINHKKASNEANAAIEQLVSKNKTAD